MVTVTTKGEEARARQVMETLAEAGAQNPELASFYEFHQRVFQLHHEAKTQIAATLKMIDDQALQVRVQRGLPLLSFAQLPMEVERFAKLVSTVAQLLADYDADLAEQTVPDSPTEWLALARQRFEEGQASREQGEGEAEVALAGTAVDLALRPYLERAAEQVLPHVDQERWKRGYCPVCGGAPDFATLDAEAGARHLLCWRCNSQWLYRRVGCPFCGTTDHTQLSYYPSEDGVYRLYVCQQCRRYLKTVDLRKVGRAVLLPVERVTTVAMDAAAQQEGYR